MPFITVHGVMERSQQSIAKKWDKYFSKPLGRRLLHKPTNQESQCLRDNCNAKLECRNRGKSSSTTQTQVFKLFSKNFFQNEIDTERVGTVGRLSYKMYKVRTK